MLTAPPIRTPLTQQNNVRQSDKQRSGGAQSGLMHDVWQRWYTKLYQAVNGPVQKANTPTNAVPGTVGQITEDGNFLYIFSGTAGVWKKVPLSSL